MPFGEKLFKLRKEKGLSQETLAEKLNTSRQAISKWENGQGYPETEKLLMIGNIFEVSIDYLLKETAEEHQREEKGFYVSEELAEGFLGNARKISNRVALGISLLILSTVPYLALKGNPAIYTLLIIVIATIGIGVLISAAFLEEDRFKKLESEALLLDQKLMKELTVRYGRQKKRSAPIILVGICAIVASGIGFLLEKKAISLGVLVPYYPILAALIAFGAYLVIRTAIRLEAYSLLVENEKHMEERTNKLSFKLKRKVKKILS